MWPSEGCRDFEHDGNGGIRDVSDAQLATSIAQSSEVALAEAYWRHRGAVYGLARRVVNNSSEAEDITQDIFLRLWNRPECFDPARGSLRNFLLAQSHSRAIDAVRSRSARRVAKPKVLMVIARRATTCSMQCGISCWPARLPRPCDGFPTKSGVPSSLPTSRIGYVVVAEILDQPEGTVKSRIRTGMRKMRAILLDAGIDGAGV